MSNSAKNDVADYSIATRFGKGERITHDARWKRPKSRNEALAQIEATYRHTRWGKVERSANHWMLGLQIKPALSDYTDAELKIILSDMERFRMIIYED